MKKIILSVLLAMIVTSVHAKVVPSKNANINASDVDRIFRLVDKKDDGSSHKKLQIVVTDRGMSTDVSPRYSVYLGYASLAEMGNITTNFLVNEDAIDFISARRIAAGIYEIKVLEYREDGMYEVTHEIDTTAMFIEEKRVRSVCGDDFCDQELKTTVSVLETSAVKR